MNPESEEPLDSIIVSIRKDPRSRNQNTPEQSSEVFWYGKELIVCGSILTDWEDQERSRAPRYGPASESIRGVFSGTGVGIVLDARREPAPRHEGHSAISLS